MEALENFKGEIEEIEELLTQPPEYIYSKLYNFAKLRILLEDLHLDKKELDEYARKVGKEYVTELELTDFPPDIAEKIKGKMFERLRKSVENMKRIYNEALQLNDKIEKAVLELEKDRYSPFEMNGVKYNGDIFHSWIHSCVEDKFGKHIDKTLALLIYLEIAERLRRDGYWVHS